MAGIAAPNIVKDGLVFYVDAANQRSYPGSGTIATDLINKIEGTLQSSGMFETNNFGIFDFDGGTNYIDFGNNSILQITGAITISLWFKTSTTSAQGLIAKGDYFATPGNTGYQLSLYDGKIWFKFSDGTTNVQLSPTTNWSNGEWHNVVAMWDGTTNTNGVKLFFNNAKIDETTSSISSIQNVSDNFIVSYNSNGGGGHLNGQIAPFQVYNKALSAAEVKQNYNALKGRFGL